MQKPRVSTVVAIGSGNRAIGEGGKLLWHIPEDLKRFKAITLGHPVVMGRKTFDSIVAILGKPLPGRVSIVITRDATWHYPEVIVVHSLEEGLAKARELDQKEIFIGGGGQIYEQALPFLDRLYLTLIDEEKEGDSFFPPYEHLFTKKISEEAREWKGVSYRWVTLERD
ncbi:hypothetical protein A3D66_01575 [Candidatus Kaiserbacteria bacterium RIFCSPHIGHO2_02_FULL_50_9]|uniref:Dihydrofolate reductase n=1 Tax=Candidatus Kaiserbacteria bacterium RIFCSPLOWO2_01_FULL_51_21 TaxID=1798508 RepID=A0A1F6ED60_9BACT|nr:MAG: hypothetical protein A2761_02265 [Candidatus Kaiserbacteria bacterium RIFCSPHIGHO2_01_FULL_51_33]OGG63782.1 MAG: hypothetical protein A3D66_01575 [Candidatus Kaiserbacteria bacterium RIFCSPHIGHO2_02_FULL_50_9]OGG71614.1 MAG: hypothetical protein A3A35_00355 [Candidatus Kaiserbacteria bacterium RIFCSPLOWO2_01_FULL_51_21]